MLKIILTDRDLQFETQHPVTGVEFCFSIEADQLTHENHSQIKTLFERGHPVWLSATMADLTNDSRLQKIVQYGFDVLLLRQCSGPQDIEKAGTLLTVGELEAGQSPGQIAIIAAFADTALAAHRLPVWSFVPDRLAGCLLDLERLAQSLGLAGALLPSGALMPPLSTVRDYAILAAAAMRMPLYNAIGIGSVENVAAELDLFRQWVGAGLLISHQAQIPVMMKALRSSFGPDAL